MSTNNNIADANRLWGFVLRPATVHSKSASLAQSSLLKLIKEVASTDFKPTSKTRQDVIMVAQFIANIEPSYLNSDKQYVELPFLRVMSDLDEETIVWVCEKIEEVVKPYISVGNETIISGTKLKIKTTMPKKKLIHAAVRHLLLGSEIFKDPKVYHELKARSMFKDSIKTNYAWLVGLALALNYQSVMEMMEDMCLKFIDQTDTVRTKGQVMFYDGTIRTENL